MTGELILGILCGGAAGAAVTALLMRGTARNHEMRARMLESRLADTESRHRQEMADADTRHRRLLDETMRRVTAEMRSATDTMLRDRQRELAEDNRSSIDSIVRPLKENMEQMRKAMSDNVVSQTSLGAVIRENLLGIIAQGEAMRGSADRLADALRNRSKHQGNWGERVLGELLESIGLREGYHYSAQKSMTDELGVTRRSEEGAVLIPDVIMHLDEQRELIIDSKVSLKDFLDFVDAGDDEERRRRALDAHVASIRKHVAELSKKDYSRYIPAGKTRVDYVIMFVPNTGALWTALDADPALWRNAMEKNVFIADEQTLYAALRIIELTWRQIEQANNRRRVFELAETMVERVSRFAREYREIGDKIDALRRAYDKADVKLRTSGPSIVTTARQLTQIGVRSSPLPEPADDTDPAVLPPSAG